MHGERPNMGPFIRELLVGKPYWGSLDQHDRQVTGATKCARCRLNRSGCGARDARCGAGEGCGPDGGVKAENAWRQARIDGDVAFLEHFYAKEARIQGMDGKTLARDADIAMFKTGQIKPKFITHGPLNITTYGEIAVVTGVDHLGGTAFGPYGEMFLRFTDVLVRRDGRWQLVVQQTTSTTGFSNRLLHTHAHTWSFKTLEEGAIRSSG